MLLPGSLGSGQRPFAGFISTTEVGSMQAGFNWSYRPVESGVMQVEGVKPLYVINRFALPGVSARQGVRPPGQPAVLVSEGLALKSPLRIACGSMFRV